MINAKKPKTHSKEESIGYTCEAPVMKAPVMKLQ